ncbi:unnamed protein product [Allacma fusca]|uniref:Uncharacterized protein n=1 Tax=Allacma fusca TaxID=39272 RepID=A0A8J2PVX4_9HEXA|nr:unnamed protein product [Allacma fusca]
MEILTFVTVIIFVVSCVVSESRSLPQPISQSRCYNKSLYRSTSIDVHQIEVAIADVQGEFCFRSLASPEINVILDKSTYGNELIWTMTVAKLSEDFCPYWNRSKECLSNHFLAHCSSDEVQKIRSDLLFNSGYVTSELACDPRKTTNNIFYLLKNALFGGLWECFDDMKHFELYYGCVVNQTGFYPFEDLPVSTEISILQKCGPALAKPCSQDDPVKELQLQMDYDAVIGAINDAYETLWREVQGFRLI